MNQKKTVPIGLAPIMDSLYELIIGEPYSNQMNQYPIGRKWDNVQGVHEVIRASDKKGSFVVRHESHVDGMIHESDMYKYSITTNLK